jgi:acyl-coenzyme A synthetase/AMP-(fatty) acid ligase
VSAAFGFEFSSGQRLCVGGARAPLTHSDLGRGVARVRSALPAGELCFLVDCADRALFLVACLALWSAGRRVVLAQNEKPGAMREVAAAVGARCVLTDRPGAVLESLRAISVEDAEGVESVEEALSAVSRETAKGFSVEAEQPLVTLFTSGTTGQPTRVDKVARQLLGEAELLASAFELGPASVVLATVPASHLYGLLFSLLVPYRAGACFVRETPFLPSAVWDSVEMLGVSDLVTVPTHLRALVSAVPRGSAVQLGTAEELSSAVKRGTTLCRVFSSGAVLEPALAAAFVSGSGASVIDVLGSTESGGIALREPATSETYRVLPGVRVETNPDGRMLLSSPFLENPSVPTLLADRVSLTDGGFRFEGRADGVFKIGGKRIAVQDLERLARALPGVEDAAVLMVETESSRGHEPWLLLAAPDAQWTLERVREALDPHLDAVVLPRRLRVLGRLPRNALGKLERSAALEAFGERPADD